MNLSQPLFLLILIPLLLVVLIKKRSKGFIFSSNSYLNSLPKSLKQATSFIPELLFYIGVACLIVALAGPQKVTNKNERNTEGLAVELVIDRSSSMNTTSLDGLKPVSRLEATKKVVTEFVFGEDENELSGRESDLVGMIVFAKYADTLYPLTLSHKSLKPVIESLETANTELDEDGTNIGDAIAIAAARLKMLDDKDDFNVKSRIIILLTDGENNVGVKTPLEAAKIAADWGIKIYSIQFGEKGYINYNGRKMYIPGSQGNFKELQTISEMTGAKAYKAKDSKALLSVYKDIDRLEKTEIKSYDYIEKEDKYFNFLLVGISLLLISMFLKYSYYRSV